MNKKHLHTSFLLAGTLFVSTGIYAVDLGEGLANESDALLLKNHNGSYSRWNGVGNIFWNDEPNCTASLLDTRDKHNNAVGPAYLLTAAHCLVDEQAFDQPVEETVKFNYFNDTANAYKSYKINNIVWKDYKHTDLAVLELDATLSTLLADGINPLRMASEWPRVTGDVLVVGAPQDLQGSGLRLAACAQEPTGATLVEDFRAYLDTLKNRCKEIRPGSSGSPVLDRNTGQILSVLTTSTYGAKIDEKCFVNAPCEIRRGQPVLSSDTHYSVPVDYLSGCFSNGVFSNDSNACAPYTTFKILDLSWPTQYITMPEDISSLPPAVQVDFTLSTAYYRFKTVRDVALCQSPHDYSDTFDATDASLKAPISRESGMHYLCIIGVESADHRPSIELLKSAWVTPAQLIERTPVRTPVPTITLSADWNYHIKWQYSIPMYYGTLYYTSPAKDTDCNAIPVKDYIETFEAITFTAEKLPLTLCSRNKDLSDRYSSARTDLLALP
ncbi:serine protease [Pseudomonas silesiensis]|uniref:trypsin-like serine peptidase n=1 Tax=Pseudomonas silesiensis TaxID=1853130 RepID=UPI0030D2D51D